MVNEKIRAEALLFAVYAALCPAYQILNISGNGTINRYIGILIMAVIIFKKLVQNRPLDAGLLYKIMPMMLWFAFTAVWSVSRSSTVNSLVTLISYVALWYLCSESEWNNREKKLVCILSVLAGLYYSYVLIMGQLAGDRRSTLVLNATGDDADQNGLGVALAYITLITLHCVFNAKKRISKVLGLLACLIFIIGILATGSRGALIALIIGAVYYINSYTDFYNKRSTGTKILLIVSVGFLIYLIMTQNFVINNETLIRYSDQTLLFETEGSGRLPIWKKYFQKMLSSPFNLIMGFGYGAAYRAYASYDVAVHNTYLYMWVASGIIGLGFFINFLCMHLKKARENNDLLGFSCLLAAMIAMFTLDMYTNKGFWNTLIFAQIGIGTAWTKETDEPETDYYEDYEYEQPEEKPSKPREL